MHLVKPLNGGSGRGKEGRLRPCLRRSEGIRSEGTPSSPSCTCVRRGPVACAVGSWPDPVLLLPARAAVPMCVGRPSARTCSCKSRVVILRAWLFIDRNGVSLEILSRVFFFPHTFASHCPRPVSSSPCLSAASENASPSMQCAWHQPPPFHVAVTEH